MKRELTHGSLFSGVEGFGLGAALAGIRTEWSCEFEEYQTEVIKKNFGDGHTVYGDIRTLENPPFVNIISGGFPCQDISAAGKGAGIKGSRSDYGDKCTELLEESDPIMSLSKIALYLESEDSNTSYMDFPKSGMMHSGSVYKVASLDCNNAEKGYISLPTPCVSSAKGSPCNRFFGSPTYRGNFHEYIRDGESDGIYPNPELSEALMSFPVSWTETNA